MNITKIKKSDLTDQFTDDLLCLINADGAENFIFYLKFLEEKLIPLLYGNKVMEEEMYVIQELRRIVEVELKEKKSGASLRPTGDKTSSTFSEG